MYDDNDDAIVTTAGERFTRQEHADLAWMIFRRWGRDARAACCAWRRLFQSTCEDSAFLALLRRATDNDGSV